MSGKFQVPAKLADKLRSLNICPEEVLHRAGLSLDSLDRPRLLLDTSEFFAFWRGLRQVSPDPALGLKLGDNDDQIERYDAIAIAALCARNLGDSLERMARYKQFTCPEEIHIRRTAKECEVHFRWLLAHEDEPEFLIDLCFAWVLSIARRGIGEPIAPARIELARPPKHRQMYERFFKCPVHFEAPHNLLIFHAADVDRIYKTHNEELLSLIAPALDEELKKRAAQDTLPDRVRRIVQSRLAGQRPTIQEIAKELRMSARTLQRRLTEMNSSFQKLVEEARRELARHYLTNSPLELNETAYLLGYEDMSSFVRAFHAWEGMPPASWRETQRGAGIDTRAARVTP